ncbi:MAG TPA: two-component regulator propeller domain-containing protein, partial [Spirochaetia bacterium]|nr:two-component regulator propeller domain-containing protein [Spirochaetia bacterium]
MLRILRDAANDEQTRAECLSLSVTAALAGGDQYLARYFAKILAAEVPASPWTFPSCFRVASTAYAAGSYDAALELYRASVASADAGSAAPVQDIELALLRTAELLLYHERDASSAQAYFRRVVPANVPPTETPLLRAMRVRLVWGTLTPRDLGLPDGNVSALLVDQDDLWVGTWNGGVARYSVSARHSDSFPTPSSVRALGLAGHRVWVGGADGLSWYGKET